MATVLEACACPPDIKHRTSARHIVAEVGNGPDWKCSRGASVSPSSSSVHKIPFRWGPSWCRVLKGAR